MATARERTRGTGDRLLAERHARTRPSQEFACVLSGSLDKLRQKLGGDPEFARALDGDGASALHMAAGLGYEECALALLQSSAETVNHQDDSGYTPLMAAVASGQLAVVGLLLKHGADSRTIAYNRSTLLHVAAAEGHASVAAALLRMDDLALPAKDMLTMCDVAGWTPLHAAAARGHRAVCQVLLAHGAAVHAKDSDGASPFLLALKRNHPLVVDAFIEADAHEEWVGELSDSTGRMLRQAIDLAWSPAIVTALVERLPAMSVELDLLVLVVERALPALLACRPTLAERVYRAAVKRAGAGRLVHVPPQLRSWVARRRVILWRQANEQRGRK